MLQTTKRKRVSHDQGRRVRPIQPLSLASSDISEEISPTPFVSKPIYQATDLDLSNKEIRLVELSRIRTHISYILSSIERAFNTQLHRMWEKLD